VSFVTAVVDGLHDKPLFTSHYLSLFSFEAEKMRRICLMEWFF